jgi:lysyl-tRNA synthetase class 1
MFLDEKGEKISKSKGNGLSLEEWLRYGSEPSLSFYIYREPKRAKSLHIGVIPRAVDEYWQFREKYPEQPLEQQLGNPVHHIHRGKVPEPHTLPVTFGLLLNLVSLPGLADRETAWAYLNHFDQSLSPENNPELDDLVVKAVNYARDFVMPTLKRRPPVGVEIDALKQLDKYLASGSATAWPDEDPSVSIQNQIYEIGKELFGKDNLGNWFRALYETLLGSSQGPRMGSFIALYGIENTRDLIGDTLNRS